MPRLSSLLRRTCLHITIGAMLSLVETSEDVVEGNTGNTSVDFCIELDSALQLDRDVVLLLNTVPLTASKLSGSEGGLTNTESWRHNF